MKKLIAVLVGFSWALAGCIPPPYVCFWMHVSPKFCIGPKLLR